MARSRGQVQDLAVTPAGLKTTDKSMNALDIIFLVIVGFLTAKGFLRGFIRELASIAGLVLGYTLAGRYYTLVLPWARQLISTEAWAQAASYLAIFIGTMVAIGILVWIVTAVLKLAMLTTANHALGGVFGLAKGMAICAVILVALDSFLPQADFLQGSRLAPHLRPVASLLMEHLPQGMRESVLGKQKTETGPGSHAPARPLAQGGLS